MAWLAWLSIGYGFFLLPDLPGKNGPVSALKTTPIRSGLIEVTPPAELP